MNRKKKLNSILRKRAKKANAKLAPKGKSAYVSKAEREAIALADQNLAESQENTQIKENLEPRIQDS
jgi:hypothetical protein